MRRIAKERFEDETIYWCFRYEDEAKEAAMAEEGFDSLGETMVSRERLNIIENDVPDFGGETNAYIAYDKDFNELGVFGFFEIREDEEE